LRRLLFLGWLALQAVLAADAFAQAAAPGVDASFPIYEFEVDGNSVLDVPTIEAALMPFMGEARRFDDVEKAREALEKVYQRAGFLTVLVDIPEQRVSDGLVRLAVVEGRVAQLYVTGSRYYDQGAIRAALTQLEPGQVPDFNAVQRQIATISRDERQVQPVLRPGRLPGTVEVELKVADKLPLAASIELSNAHTANTVPWRLQASLRYDNLFQLDHSIGLTLITAPESPKQSGVLMLNYGVPLGDGVVWSGSLVASDSTVEPLGAATVIGKGVTLGSHWLRTIARERSVHAIGYGFDLKRTREETGQPGQAVVSTPVRYLPFSASYTGNWDSRDVQTSLGMTLVAATRSLLSRQVDCPDFLGNIFRTDQFACKRHGADGSFATWRADLRHTVTDSAYGTLALRLAGQLATTPVVSAEQFAIGGADTVRGYLEAEATGDHALLASAEWLSPDLVRPLLGRDPAGDGLKAIAFVDAAKAHTLQPAAGQPGSVGLVGAGIGLRAQIGSGLRADVDVAWPQRTTLNTPNRDPRVHVRVAAHF
jgi:hemolysin activation/secretion protein